MPCLYFSLFPLFYNVKNPDRRMNFGFLVVPLTENDLTRRITLQNDQ